MNEYAHVRTTNTELRHAPVVAQSVKTYAIVIKSKLCKILFFTEHRKYTVLKHKFLALLNVSGHSYKKIIIKESSSYCIVAYLGYRVLLSK